MKKILGSFNSAGFMTRIRKTDLMNLWPLENWIVSSVPKAEIRRAVSPCNGSNLLQNPPCAITATTYLHAYPLPLSFTDIHIHTHSMHDEKYYTYSTNHTTPQPLYPYNKTYIKMHPTHYKLRHPHTTSLMCTHTNMPLTHIALLHKKTPQHTYA